MAWKQAGNSTMHDFNKDAHIEGEYLASKKVRTSKGDSMVYTVRTDAGVKEFWGSTVLDRAFVEIPSGAMIRVTYNGKKQGKKGTEFKDFLIEYDDEDVPVEAKHEEEDEIQVENIPF